MEKLISIYSNELNTSRDTETILMNKLEKLGYSVKDGYDEQSELLICIGGDGTFLEAIHKFNFPQLPILGINTGHLGFFEEIEPSQIDEFLFNYQQGKFSLQPLTTVKIKITAGGKTYEHQALNEVIIRSADSHSIHLNMSIGGSYIERFTGDGLLVATPAGSTAYNYSLRGSIVDPRLELLQVTPMAPMNTTAYRTFTSSILLPPDLDLELIPDMVPHSTLNVVRDSSSTIYEDVESLRVFLSETKINLIRFESYDFWEKVKSKFL